jgi:hypothetical protein
MTEEQTRKQIMGILGDLDLPFSVKKTQSGKTSWTIDLSIANTQVVQVMLIVQGDWLYFFYFHNFIRATDPDVLTQLLKLNARGNLAKIGLLSSGNRLVAWTTLWNSTLTQDLVSQSLGQVARAAEQIKTLLSSQS